jgi:hypothetical protein
MEVVIWQSPEIYYSGLRLIAVPEHCSWKYVIWLGRMLTGFNPKYVLLRSFLVRQIT